MKIVCRIFEFLRYVGTDNETIKFKWNLLKDLILIKKKIEKECVHEWNQNHGSFWSDSLLHTYLLLNCEVIFNAVQSKNNKIY